MKVSPLSRVILSSVLFYCLCLANSVELFGALTLCLIGQLFKWCTYTNGQLGSPGLVVMGGDSLTEGRGFKSQRFKFTTSISFTRNQNDPRILPNKHNAGDEAINKVGNSWYLNPHLSFVTNKYGQISVGFELLSSEQVEDHHDILFKTFTYNNS